MSRLELEALEARDCPSSANLTGGVLTVLLDGPAPTLSVNGTAALVSVVINNQAQSFANVTSLVLIGNQHQPNIIENNTALPATILGGDREDTLFGGSGNDTILADRRRDVVYDLLGANTIDTSGDGPDRVFTNAASGAVVDPQDRLVTFFATGRAPNSGVASLERGTLYLTPPVGGSLTQLSGNSGQLTLTSSWAGTQTFSGVKQIAYFGGSGDDTYLNATRIDDVFYGAGGNDTLVGGTGKYSLGKGSSGNDVVVGRAKTSDLSGNAGTDVLFALVGHRNVFRVDGQDTVVGSGVTLGPGL
jgi:Ca2+-binding RTX toxin-like protein